MRQAAVRVGTAATVHAGQALVDRTRRGTVLHSFFILEEHLGGEAKGVQGTGISQGWALPPHAVCPPHNPLQTSATRHDSGSQRN